MTYSCRKCGQPKPVSVPCLNCGRIRSKAWLESNREKKNAYLRRWRKNNKKKVASYRDTTIIAPRHTKPPRYQAHLKSSECDRCPSHPQCKVYARVGVPIECESVRKSDLLDLRRVGECRLREIGWLDRTKTWDTGIWERYYEAVKEIA